MKSSKLAKRVSHLAATELFTGGAKTVADRLMLVTAENRDLGGWCFGAVRDRIEACIIKAVTNSRHRLKRERRRKRND